MKKLWYAQPAREWEEALPIGNGRLGGMLFGTTAHESIQLNEESIWSGNYRDRNNVDARANLDKVRHLVNEGELRKAERLCQEALSGTPEHQRVYQTAGDVNIDFLEPVSDNAVSPVCAPHPAPFSDYRRELDLERAVVTVSFTVDGVAFRRECFASAADDVIVMRVTASRPRSINLRLSLWRGVFADRMWNVSTDTIGMARDSDVAFCAMMKAVPVGGEARTRGGYILVEGADEALLFIDARTAFREKDWEGRCQEHLDACASKGWDELLSAHLDDYRRYFNRMAIDLSPSGTVGAPGSGADAESLPTDERLARFKASGDDLGLVSLYCDFSRYLLISCSRPGTLPATLQGLWNRHLDPPWGSKYTININTEMNYWPAGMCGLPEMQEPLFDLLARAYPNGRKTAEVMYGCRGFVAHHNLDLWGDTAPQDHWLPGTHWVLGAAWLATHIRDQYEYTGDRAFLERNYYLMREACRFFVDFLIPGAQTIALGPAAGQKQLVIHPSVSPENTYRLPNGEAGSLCAGCEMDNQILTHLFAATIESAEDLGLAAEGDVAEFRAVLARIAPPVIHSNGTLREWNEEFEETEIGHRHVSHLYALWPGQGISPDETPELAAAARRTLDRRLANGGGHTGWSRAWIVNFRARLRDGDEAWSNVKALLSSSTLPNLFDNHPPFQIDGNFGGLSGIVQMLMQSRLVTVSPADRLASAASVPLAELRLLPALPSAWPNGSARGLVARGGIVCDIAWSGGKLTTLSLTARHSGFGTAGRRVRIRYGDAAVELELAPGTNLIDVTRLA